jgi:hypothetical protein
MKILFYPSNCVPFTRNTLQERPLGGTETAVIHLSRALADLGKDVFVVSPLKEIQGNPQYILADEIKDMGEMDAYIGVRDWRVCFHFPYKRKKVFFWTSDAADVVHNLGIGDPRVYTMLAGLLCVSKWQRNSLCLLSHFPLQKTWILRNGIYSPDFAGEEVRQRKRLIYLLRRKAPSFRTEIQGAKLSKCS